MSRIGKKIISIPSGVTASYKDGVMEVKGPKGTLTQEVVESRIDIQINKDTIQLVCNSSDREANAKHGLYRALIANMVEGVTNGFKKTLVVNGIGYKVAVKNNDLKLNIGFSHPVEVKAPEGLTVTSPQNLQIEISGIDKCEVGQFAAKIRALKKPEPYHGYGIRYIDEVIERKEGKTAGK